MSDASAIPASPHIMVDLETMGTAPGSAIVALGAVAFDPLADVLARFVTWWRLRGGQFIWSHGGNFDEPLLAAAFRAARLTLPWKYWDARCTRTLFALTGERPDRAAGVHHAALDDARAQAEAVIRAYARLARHGLFLHEAATSSPPAQGESPAPDAITRTG